MSEGLYLFSQLRDLYLYGYLFQPCTPSNHSNHSFSVFTFQTTTAHVMLCGIICSAALVRVPSIGLSRVEDTQPVTPVSVTKQVCVK